MRAGDLRHATAVAANTPVSVAPAQLVCNKTMLGLQ